MPTFEIHMTPTDPDYDPMSDPDAQAAYAIAERDEEPLLPIWTPRGLGQRIGRWLARHLTMKQTVVLMTIAYRLGYRPDDPEFDRAMQWAMRAIPQIIEQDPAFGDEIVHIDDRDSRA